MTRKQSSMAAAAQSRSERIKTPSSSADESKMVSMSAQMPAEWRQGLRTLGARYGLSLSTTIAAFGAAAAEGDERLDEIMDDHAATAHRPRGLPSHDRSDTDG